MCNKMYMNKVKNKLPQPLKDFGVWNWAKVIQLCVLKDL